jgi:hypothetical protein
MTKQEIQAKSKEKVQAVEKFLKQMELTVSAEQMITEQGFIKTVVFYTDNEKYDLDKPKLEPTPEKPVEATTEADKKDE